MIRRDAICVYPGLQQLRRANYGDRWIDRYSKSLGAAIVSSHRQPSVRSHSKRGSFAIVDLSSERDELMQLVVEQFEHRQGSTVDQTTDVDDLAIVAWLQRGEPQRLRSGYGGHPKANCGRARECFEVDTGSHDIDSDAGAQKEVIHGQADSN